MLGGQTQELFEVVSTQILEDEDILGSGVDFLLIVCFLFRAKTGEEPSSHGLLGMSFRDSLTTSSGKLRTARDPLVENAAWSYAKAAASAVSNVPIHTRTPFLVESLISAANFPHGLFLTPLYILLSFGAVLEETSCDSTLL
ncbi:hypothetical protein CR513_47965, partial [Mucuna pruriens]